MNVNIWKQKGTYFDFEGNSIFYIDKPGKKEMLLCMHGFPTSSYDFHKIWDGLSEKFSLAAFDLIGYGLSGKPANFDYTTFKQADIFEALVSHLKIEKLHILCHDYGNTVVKELLARREENKLNFKIESVCMMNGGLFPETHRPILAQKILISPVGFLFTKLLSDTRLMQSLASVFGKETQPSDEELGEFLDLVKYNNGDRITHKLIRYMREREIYRERWVGAFERFDKPFRIIVGLDDPVSGAHMLKRFREIMPHEDIIEIKNIGHFPHFEAPQWTLKYFFEFHRL